MEGTLFIITFDETGGFYDHVPAPTVPRPDNGTWVQTTSTGNYTFNFGRLGGRLPTWIISPWVVDQGYVEDWAATAIARLCRTARSRFCAPWATCGILSRLILVLSIRRVLIHLIGSRMQNSLTTMPAP